MGFLSTVPSDADQRLRDAVTAAANAKDNFPGMFLNFLPLNVAYIDARSKPTVISESAPSGTAKHIQTNSNGVAQSTATGGPHASNSTSGASRVHGVLGCSSWFSLATAVLLVLSFSSASTALSI